MNNKLVKKIREAEEEVAGEIVSTRSEGNRDAARMRAMFVLGGVTVAKRAAKSFDTEAIKTLIRFQEEKMHEDLGYSTFVDFLNESEFAPLTKAQFYEGKALLEKEGEDLFDLMTDLGISIRKRKLLGKGNVELAGDKLIVHDGDEITEIPITDKSSILDAIASLADANADKSIKLQRQAERIEKHDAEKRELYDDLDRIKASKLSEVAATPHMNARVELGIAFRKLTEAADNLSPIEKDQFRDGVFEDIAAWRSGLMESYKTDTKRTPVETTLSPDDTIETGFDKFFEDNKLADLL